MKDLLLNVRRHFVNRRLRARRKDELRRMSASSDATTRAIGRAISDVLEQNFSEPERRALAKITELREELLAQTDREITLTDYGAGNPEDEYSPEEMERGVVVVRKVSDICRAGGLSPLWNQVLFKLIRHTSRQRALELGTSLGISAAYQASALRLNGDDARLLTLDGAQPLADIAAENWKKLGLTNVSVRVGRFQDTLDGALAEQSPIDYAFVDGHHDEQATLGYFRKLLEHSKGPAVLVFDDILWYPKMQDVWQRIRRSPEVVSSVDLKVIGVVVTASGRSGAGESYALDPRDT